MAMTGPTAAVEAVARRFFASCVAADPVNIAVLDEEPDDLSSLLRRPAILVRAGLVSMRADQGGARVGAVRGSGRIRAVRWSGRIRAVRGSGAW